MAAPRSVHSLPNVIEPAAGTGIGRRSRWRLIAGVAALLVLLAGLGAGGKALAARQRTLTLTPQSDPALWRPALEALLDRRTAAVRGHDEAAFLADVDGTDPAFVRRQRDIFANLVQLHVTEFALTLTEAHRYSLANDYTVPGDEAALAGRFRATAALRVTVRLRIDGVDPQPVAVPWVPIVGFATRGWVVAAESDDATLPGDAGGQPWDGGPVVVTRGSAVTLVVDQGRPDVTQRLLPLAETAVTAVLAFRSAGWPGRVLVTALDDPAVYSAYLRQRPGEYTAFAVPLYAAVLDWDPGAADRYVTTRVVLNPKYFEHLLLSELKPVLVHELTHVAMFDLTSDDTPTWLAEGVPEVVAAPFQDRSPAAVAELIRRIGIPDTMPAADDDPFFSKRENYDFAWLACQMILERYGRDRLIALYAAFKHPTDMDTALRQNLGLDSGQFLRAWQAYLRALSK
jgi:hypothetical protein